MRRCRLVMTTAGKTGGFGRHSFANGEDGRVPNCRGAALPEPRRHVPLICQLAGVDLLPDFTQARVLNRRTELLLAVGNVQGQSTA